MKKDGIITELMKRTCGSNANINRKVMVIGWLPVFIWMGVIFLFSSQTGEQSGGLSGVIKEFLMGLIKITALQDILHFLVRKSAHLGEYFVLGILVSRAFLKSGIIGARIIFWTLLFCFLYAGSDEIHQLFIPGRSGQFTDVLIDSSGALCGSVLWFFITKRMVKQTFVSDRKET